jgi:flagellar hook-associated protein 3 FlgL
VLAGQDTGDPPYTPGGGDAYDGDTRLIARQIGPGVSVQINTNASDLLGTGGGDTKLIDNLRNIAAHLRSGTVADRNALRNGDLKALSTNHDELNKARATLGAVQSRLDSAKSRLADVEMTTTQLLANTEDTDLAKAILELTNQQNVYSAALRSGASLIQPSLLDFLR